MSKRTEYKPGPATGVQVRKEDKRWTLIIVRELRQAPEKVWQALIDPEQLKEWAPFDAEGRLDSVGASVKFSTVNAPQEHVTETKVIQAEAPKLLEYNWGDQELRWELEPVGTGTRLTLWQNIDRRYISMGAAGWHICFDVLEYLLSDEPIGRIVGMEAMKFDWPRLNKEYAEQFGLKKPEF